MKYFFYTILCILSFVMCTGQSKELQPELSLAESLMQQHPDSALVVLESIKEPTSYNESQYALWCLLITQARDKNYIKHTSDTLIRVALNYFDKQHDPVKKATALYYAGRVNHDLQHAEEATKYYLQAKEVAQSTTDYNLLYLICSQLGTLYAYRDLNELAQDAYLQAYNYAVQQKDSALISYTYSYLGRVATLEEDWDKGLDYYKKAIHIANKSECWRALSLAYGEISSIYNVLSMSDSCLTCLRKAMAIEEAYIPSALPQTYLGLGELYYSLDRLDSADFYLEKALNTTNLYTKKAAMEILVALHKEQGEYEEAVLCNDLYRAYKDSIEAINNSAQIAVIKEKHDQKKLLGTNKQLWNSILWILAAMFVTIVWYQYRLRKKELKIKENKSLLQLRLRQLKENESIIHENENLINVISSQLEDSTELQEHVSSQKAEIERIRRESVSLQQQNTKLSAQLLDYLFADLKSTPHYIEDSEWSDIYASIGVVYPGWIERLRKDFSLTDADLQICSLIKLQLNNSTIAKLLAVSSSSVTKRKQRLKDRINQYLDTPLGGENSIESYLGKY
jgi:tetratricopeptide (TPR) repeat protein